MSSSRNWNTEWDMEQAEVNELIASFAAMQNCDHEWGPLPEEDQSVFSDDTEAESCPKCGAVQVKVTEAEFTQFQQALEDGRARQD